GCPYNAVGMQRASHSAIGLPSSSTSASWMLAFLMPADVRRSFSLPPEFVGVTGNIPARTGPYVVETRWPTGTHRSERIQQLFRRHSEHRPCRGCRGP